MKHLSPNEIGGKWGISARRVTLLCNQGRVEGAYRMGRAWAIPEDAKKPIDPRKFRRKIKKE